MPTSAFLSMVGFYSFFGGIACLIWYLTPERLGGSSDAAAPLIPAFFLLLTAVMILGVFPETRIIFRKK